MKDEILFEVRCDTHRPDPVVLVVIAKFIEKNACACSLHLRLLCACHAILHSVVVVRLCDDFKERP